MLPRTSSTNRRLIEPLPGPSGVHPMEATRPLGVAPTLTRLGGSQERDDSPLADVRTLVIFSKTSAVVFSGVLTVKIRRR